MIISFLVPNEALTGDKPRNAEIDGGGRAVANVVQTPGGIIMK